MKTVYRITVVRKDTTSFTQLLTFSESKLFPQIVKENKSLFIEIAEITNEQYKTEFGK